MFALSYWGTITISEGGPQTADAVDEWQCMHDSENNMNTITISESRPQTTDRRPQTLSMNGSVCMTQQCNVNTITISERRPQTTDRGPRTADVVDEW